MGGKGAGDEFVGRLAGFEAGLGEGEDVVRLNVGDAGDAVIETCRGGRLDPREFERVGDEPVGAFIDGRAQAFGAENGGDPAGAKDHDRAGELDEAAEDDEFTDRGAAIPGHAGAVPAAHIAHADGGGPGGGRAHAVGGGMGAGGFGEGTGAPEVVEGTGRGIKEELDGFPVGEGDANAAADVSGRADEQPVVHCAAGRVGEVGALKSGEVGERGRDVKFAVD